MDRLLIHIAILSTTLMIVSCIDQLPILLAESDNVYLIVNAEIRDIDRQHVITLKINNAESNDFQANQPVSDAEVYILENKVKQYVFKNDNTLGEFKNDELTVMPDRKYQLFISYNGIQYTSEIEKLIPSVPINNVRTVITNEQRNNAAGNIINTDLVNVFADAQLPINEDVFLKYNARGIYEYREIGSQGNINPVFCYISELIDFDNISLASDIGLDAGKLQNQFIIQREINFKFATKYCLKIYSERISEKAFNFWNLVKNEYSRTGDIFEKPPGIIRGNISEMESTDISVVGLFSVIGVDSFDYLILPNEVGNPKPLCRTYPAPPESCYNCLIVPKSTLVKPDCFL